MRVLLAVLALLTIAGPAQAADPTIENGSAQAALDDARERWAEAGLENYRFRVRVSCFCPREYTRPYVVHVRGGKPHEPVTYVRSYASVPRLFRIVQEAIDEGYDGLEVSYGRKGLPTRVNLDPSELAIDEERYIAASRLRRESALVPHTPDPSIQDGSARRELREARMRWIDRGLHDYRFRAQLTCFCADTDPYTVRVRDGKALGRGPTVEGLFRMIDKAIRRGSAELRVRYAKAGFPRFIFEDRHRGLADEEYGFTVRELRGL